MFFMAVLPLLIQSDVLYPTYQLKSFPRICHKQPKEFLPFRMKEWLHCCMDVCSSYKYGSDITIIIMGQCETCPISEIAIIILSLTFISSFEAATFSFTNLFSPPSRFSLLYSGCSLCCLPHFAPRASRKKRAAKRILFTLSAMRNTKG